MERFENKTHDPNRNAFESYFRSLNEFGSVVLNKMRSGDVTLELIKNDKPKFVSLLIGKKEADNLSPEERDVFCVEAEKIILSHNKRVADSQKVQAEEAARAGITSEVSRAGKGRIISHGDYEAYEKHIKK